MNTYTFLVSGVHLKMSGHGGCVKASNKREARQLIIKAAAYHNCELSEERIIQLFSLDDLETIFFEPSNMYGY